MNPEDDVTNLPSHVPFVRTPKPDETQYILYRCVDSKCRAVDRMKVSVGEPILAYIQCWKCRSGMGIDGNTMAAQKIGMVAVGKVSGEGTPEEDAVTVRPFRVDQYPGAQDAHQALPPQVKAMNPQQRQEWIRKQQQNRNQKHGR